VTVGAAAYLFGARSLTEGGGFPSAAVAAETEPGLSVSPAAALSEAQKSEVEAIIREYLLANPEIVRDAINELQRKEAEAEEVAQTQTIIDNSERLFSAPVDVAIGNPAGDVTLVEFFDYNCGYCKRAHADMQALLDNDPNLKIVLKEFPILGEGSVQAAQISVAVLLTAPEKYRAFHDALLTEPGQADGATALAVAGSLGLDADALSAMAESEEVRATIGESHALARELELTGTPSYVTSRKVIVGAVGYEALKQEIDTVRACAGDVAAC
ncbi:MAG: DsbA family protein, partial [Bauldia sp.]